MYFAMEIEGQKSPFEGQEKKRDFFYAKILCIVMLDWSSMSSRNIIRGEILMSKNGKENFIRKTAASCRFALKLGWKISKKRVITEFIYEVFQYFDSLVIRCVLIRFILDMAMKETSMENMLRYVWAVVGLSVLLKIFNSFFEEYIKPVTDVELYAGINQILYEKAYQVDLACFEDSNFYNEYMMSIHQAHEKVPAMLRDISQVAAGFLSMIAAVGIIYQIDHYAVLFTIFPILGNFVFYGMLNNRLFQMERENIAFRRMIDYVNRTIHLGEYAKEIRMTNVFRLLENQYHKAIRSMHRVIGRYSLGNIVLMWLFQYFTFTLLQEGAVIYAGYRVLVSGTMVFAQMAVIQSTMNSNTWTLIDFADAVIDIVKNGLYVEQTQRFLEYEPKIPEDGAGILPELPIRTIEFSHVYFGYKEGSSILKDINFKISGNRSVALTGYNGAGKSTLIKLLLRLYDPDEGVILVNGIDIREYQVRAYRELFATAFQDGKIFADTIEENILMGGHAKESQDSYTELVWQALRCADIDESIKGMKQQEKTILTREFSKDGVVLSGGQYQKILAARAFVKKSPIAVFDEPSSALDPIAEYQLFANIKEYGKDKILFFISHRLSSVRDADIVFYMENGRIQERGTHQELMKLDGRYAALYQLQAKNYLAEEDIRTSGRSVRTGELQNGKGVWS